MKAKKIIATASPEYATKGQNFKKSNIGYKIESNEVMESMHFGQKYLTAITFLEFIALPRRISLTLGGFKINK
ncbi:7328_t:CDS:2 [Scutellospora calospora]|uniref:7328_t:CDS:1 n=1 Tax=Scutellospora calospora TaxID=85575 RepID=A0ACA9K4F3_9GLOM|nr:7328_t:CDS:2 [Scutellospora calospora]